VRKMALSILDFFNGLFSLLLVIISIIVALQILSKYFKYKEKVFIFVGLTWLGLITPWLPSSVGFLYYLMFQQPLLDIIYILLGLFIIPIIIVIWIYGFTKFLVDRYNGILLIIFLIMGIVFEFYLFIGLFMDYEVFIGIINNPSSI
jgi:hypothetical protein